MKSCSCSQRVSTFAQSMLYEKIMSMVDNGFILFQYFSQSIFYEKLLLLSEGFNICTKVVLRKDSNVPCVIPILRQTRVSAYS